MEKVTMFPISSYYTDNHFFKLCSDVVWATVRVQFCWDVVFQKDDIQSWRHKADDNAVTTDTKLITLQSLQTSWSHRSRYRPADHTTVTIDQLITLQSLQTSWSQYSHYTPAVPLPVHILYFVLNIPYRMKFSRTVCHLTFQSLVHAFFIPGWGLFYLCHKPSGQNTCLWMQVCNWPWCVINTAFKYQAITRIAG
jgi:hypothetical protein